MFAPGLGFPVLLLFFSVSILVPTVLYLIALQNTLARCSPNSRTLSPAMVWLLLIPLFNLAWHFVVVSNISKSLHNEFDRRNIQAEPQPGKGIGLAMCILACTILVPVAGIYTGVAALVCWIIYWVKVAEFGRMLEQPAAVLAR